MRGRNAGRCPGENLERLALLRRQTRRGTVSAIAAGSRLDRLHARGSNRGDP